MTSQNEEAKQQADIYSNDTRASRTPWILTTTKREGSFRKNSEDKESANVNRYNNSIIFYCNPGEYQFSIDFRQNEVITKNGTVTHNWRNPRPPHSMFHFPVFTVTFQAGNILPKIKQSYIKRIRELRDIREKSPDARFFEFETRIKFEDIAGVPEGLENFYQFLDIIDEDKIGTDGGLSYTNYATLYMNTLVFPSLVLKGFFTNNIQWNENAETPSDFFWQGTMTIHETVPKIGVGQFIQLMKSYKNNIKAPVQ